MRSIHITEILTDIAIGLAVTLVALVGLALSPIIVPLVLLRMLGRKVREGGF